MYNFVVKWNEKFRDPDIDYIQLVDHYLADDCSALKFEMDCGHAFEEKFEKAVYDARALDTIIENVNDNVEVIVIPHNLDTPEFGVKAAHYIVEEMKKQGKLPKDFGES